MPAAPQDTKAPQPVPHSPAVTQNGARSVSLGLPSCPLQLCHHSKWCLCGSLCGPYQPTNPVLDMQGSSAPSVTQDKAALPLNPPSAAGPAVIQDGACTVGLVCHLLANIVLERAELHSASLGPTPAAPLSLITVPSQ